MRLARLVAAGLVLGAAVGFVTALVRPRDSRSAGEPSPATSSTGSLGSAASNTPTAQVRPAGAGADLPTRPIPLPIPPALAGTGGAR
jgi:hypothetical protein